MMAPGIIEGFNMGQPEFPFLTVMDSRSWAAIPGHAELGLYWPRMAVWNQKAFTFMDKAQGHREEAVGGHRVL